MHYCLFSRDDTDTSTWSLERWGDYNARGNSRALKGCRLGRSFLRAEHTVCTHASKHARTYTEKERLKQRMNETEERRVDGAIAK